MAMLDRRRSRLRMLALVVDDEPDFRVSLTQLLDSLGFKVIAAADGKAAFTLLQSESPDLVLLDLFMPGMDGIELMRRLNESGQNMPPVIALTGYVDQKGVGNTALSLGARAVLLKPFTLEQLEEVLASVLQRPDMATGPVSTRPLNWAPRRVRFLGAVSRIVAGRRQFSVRLQKLTGESFEGEAAGTAAGSELRAPAEAMLDALRKMVGGATQLTLQGVLPTDAMGSDVLIASVDVVHENQTHRLFGVSQLTQDRSRAVALATLNAANRFLGLG